LGLLGKKWGWGYGVLGTPQGIKLSLVRLSSCNAGEAGKIEATILGLSFDVLAKSLGMAKQKFRYTRRSDFLGARLYIWYAEYLKNCYNAVDRNFYPQGA
jgi:hypothetical protein